MAQFRPAGGFQILPPVIKNLLIINLIFYLASTIIGDGAKEFMYRNFALFHYSSPLFKPWQFLTHMFMHGSFSHLLFNMLALWMFGNTIENYFGSKRFLIFYLICGLGAAGLYMLTQTFMGPINPFVPMVGASGAIFGLLFAFGYLFPNMVVYVQFFIPMKAKYFVAIYAALELYLGIGNSPGDNVAHFAHLGGMLIAFILMKIWNVKSNKHIS